MNLNSSYQLRSNGKPHGDVFTKIEYVQFMLDLVDYKAAKNLSEISIMEPSCGKGEFIVEILYRLKKSSQKYSFDFVKSFHNCVFAVDIDRNKIVDCICRIKKIFPELTDVEKNIRCEDFLFGSYPYFDIIVGNPPYVRYEEIPDKKVLLYKKLFSSFYYRADLYIPFFEKTLRLLSLNGKHCFICANRWMKNQYGQRIRYQIATKYRIEKIINLEKADAFQENVLAYPAITIFSRKSKKSVLEYADITSLSNIQYEKKRTPTDENWDCIFASNVSISKNFTLIEEQGFKIGIGIATGADSIYISNSFKGKIEKELLVPCINARNLSNNIFHWDNRFFLNPYEKNGTLIDLNKYPKAKRYFDQFKIRLSQRHKAKKDLTKWYGTIDKFNHDLQKKPKILLPDISGNSYIFTDDGNYYPQHNIYYVTGRTLRDLKVLAALLMSNSIRHQLESLTNHMNGGLARWQSQYLKKIRIPSIDNINPSLSESILECYEKKDLAGVNSIASEIISQA